MDQFRGCDTIFVIWFTVTRNCCHTYLAPGYRVMLSYTGQWMSGVYHRNLEPTHLTTSWKRFPIIISFCKGNLPVTCGFPSQRASESELTTEYCMCYYPEQTVEPTVQLPVISDAMTQILRHWWSMYITPYFLVLRSCQAWLTRVYLM